MNGLDLMKGRRLGPKMLLFAMIHKVAEGIKMILNK